MTLPDLIERMERASGPDRELDRVIALAKGWQEFSAGWFVPPGMTVHHHLSELPRYTASIDAALTLAGPETDPLDILEAALAACRDDRDGVFYLPLHICIAALRAREADRG